tara:strand:+ start:392 stop:865 length:474 start_codon:yes stop_codon:yes gene_type:complete
MSEETTEREHGGAVIPYEEYQAAGFNELARDDWIGPEMVANVPIGTSEGTKMLFDSMNPPTYSVDDLDGEPFAVKYFLVSRAEYQDDTEDEPRLGVKITLWNPEGESLATSSAQIARALDFMVSSFGSGPYDPAIQLKFTPAQTKRGRRTFRVEYVD